MMKTFIIAAITADGFIAQQQDQLADWTSPEDKKLFVELTKRAGVMVMGRTTFDTIGRALPGRKTIVYSHKAIDNPDVMVTDLPPAELLQQLNHEGYNEVAICGGQAIYDLFMSLALVDELYLTVEPIVFGSGIALFKNQHEHRLVLLEERKLNDATLLLHYGVKK